MYEDEDYVWIIACGQQSYWTGYKDWFTERSEYARYFGRFKTANIHCEEIRFKLGYEVSPILCIMINDPREVTPVREEATIKNKMIVEEHEDKLGENRFE